MSSVPQARAHPAGGRIDLRWSHERPLVAVGPPPLRVVRRRLGPPVEPGDGLVVFDLGELFVAAAQPWRRLGRLLFHTANTPFPEGSLEAEVTLFHPTPPPGEPTLIRLRLYDPVAQTMVEEVVTDCTRVVRSAGLAPPWAEREVLEIFRAPGGGPEEPGGLIEVLTGNLDPSIGNRLVFTPAAGPVLGVEFDTIRRLKLDRTEAPALTFEARVLDADPGVPWLTAVVRRNQDKSSETWAFTLRDAGLEPGVDYYYALFDLALAEPRVGWAVALATRDYDSPRRLFRRLPGAYQRLDEPDPAQPTGAEGPLRRFMVPIGHTLDAARSSAEGLRDRHDAFTARADLLQPLARMIGWAPDLAAPVDTQRRDVLFAPEVFDGVGTTPNVQALVNRVTAWPCRVKEFVHNVFLTNAVEEIRLWELWQVAHDGTGWGPPAPVTLTEGVDARPAAALDGGGVIWLFWHSDRSGRRELWRQRLDGVDAAPALARAGAPDDTPDFAARDEHPAAAWDGTRVWLFWSSNREGHWNLWARTYAGAPPGSAPVRLTDHPAGDRSPAAVVVPGAPDRLWLFWSSSRRGPTDIWARVLDLSTGTWGDAERLTEAPLADDRPAAAVDAAGRLWLFFTRDAGGRQTLWHQVHDGTAWSAPLPLDAGHARDEAPAAVPWNGGIFLLWHSNHGGPWQVWGRFHDGAAWQPPARLDADVHGNKEPAAVIDGLGDLRAFWRSQRRGQRYRSRTLDVTDSEMLDGMGTFEDHVHYTCDTGRSEDDWYSRDSVGLYLTPGVNDPAEVEAQLNRLRGFVEPFRPVPVRFVWLPSPPTHAEVIQPDPGVAEEWSDETP